MTDTFGKRSTRSCWKRARASAPSGPFSGATKVCGAWSSTPGPEHEHEPAVARLAPFDVADARHPRRDGAAQHVEPHRVADVQPGPLGDQLLDRHLGLRRRAVPERALNHPLVRLEVIAIGDRELAADRHAPLAHLLGALEIDLLPGDADHPRPQHRDQLELAGAVRRIAEKRAHAVGLALLDVEQEHVGRVGRHLHRELAEQARLQRPHADDEEGAEADGQQDDARLVARTRQVQHRVAQRKRPRVRQRRDQRDQRRGRPDAARPPAPRTRRTRRRRP